MNEGENKEGSLTDEASLGEDGFRKEIEDNQGKEWNDDHGKEIRDDPREQPFAMPGEIKEAQMTEPSANTPFEVKASDVQGNSARIEGNAQRPKQRSGALTFAIVMSVCFGITLLILIASLVGGGSDAFLPGLSGGSSVTDGNDTPNENIAQGNGETLTLQQISSRGKSVVVAISVQTAMGSGSGTGIIMTSDGYIATNFHVIDDAQEITVHLYHGREYSAEVIGSSEIDDLAVLKIDAQGLTAATFGNSAAALEGDRVVVIGHPAGLEFGWTSTYGFISAINRDVKIRDYDGTLIKKMTLLQTDANVNSGNSGGPMFNDRGEVIGIITMKLAGDYEGMGFAIPSNGALSLLEALMKTGTTDGVQSEVSSARPVLGVTGVSVEKDQYYVMGEDRIYLLTEEEAAETEGSFRASETGVLITAVTESSDAHEKVKSGDIIVALNGKTMTTMSRMREYLYDCSIGDEVEIEYIRDGVREKTSVRLMAAE